MKDELIEIAHINYNRAIEKDNLLRKKLAQREKKWEDWKAGAFLFLLTIVVILLTGLIEGL